MKPSQLPAPSATPSNATSGMRRRPVLTELLINPDSFSFEPTTRAPVVLPLQSPLLSPGSEHIVSELTSPSEASPKSPQDLVAEMRALLRNGDSEKRKDMIGAIVLLANTHQDGIGILASDMIAGPEFLALASDGNRSVRLAVIDAMRCLSGSRIPRTVNLSIETLLKPEIQTLLADPEADIRRHLLCTLTGFARHYRPDIALRAQQVVTNPLMAQLLRDPSVDVRREALAFVQRAERSPQPDFAARAAQLLQECRG